jgi:GTP cyclohydrolase I
MSRFVELLNEQHGRISLRNLGALLKTMADRFTSTLAHLEIRFPYFVEKMAPVSKARSLMNYQCAFLATYNRRRGRRALDLVLEVMVPVSTLCPCSKAISVQGAHNQRSWITIQVRSRELVWIEELIAIAEAEASSGLFSLLKREDEKCVTERAYARPRFAEDVARAVSRRLRRDRRITWFQVASENMESIHNHNAFALVASDGLGGD